ncbi:MAG: dicarboxylate/amino acid:cation symporter [Hyphomonadaceae bacterium]
MKHLSLIVLAALIAGIVVGALIRGTGDVTFLATLGFPAADIANITLNIHPTLANIGALIEPFGSLWLNALRMTVVPLVVSLLITAIASVSDSAKTGGLMLRAVILFTVILFAMALYSVAATNGLLALWPIDPQGAAQFIGDVGDNAVRITEPPTFASWLSGLAPYNPIRAAAEDAILALVIFTIIFAFAVTQIAPILRDQIVSFFRAVSEAMIVVVRWVLLAGPIGVFALALGVGLRAGFGAVETLTHYVVVVTSVTAFSVLIAWAIAITIGGQPIARFTRAAAPVWAIAASTQSSLASLPAMLEAAVRGLRIPAVVADVVLPLAVAVFRFTSPVANLAVCFFVAALYGHEPTTLQIASAVVVAYAVSIASVGLPGQISFVASVAPICLALGAPTEVLGILIAVEVIPDIFRTLGNVTGDLAATAILSRGAPPDEADNP